MSRVPRQAHIRLDHDAVRAWISRQHTMTGDRTSTAHTSLPLLPRGTPTTRRRAVQRLRSMLRPIQRRKRAEGQTQRLFLPAGASCRPPHLWQNMTIRRHKQATMACTTFSRTSGGGSSENEEEEPTEPATSLPPREIIHGLRITTGPAPPGLFATESSQVSTAMRALSMSSMPRQQSTQVPSEHLSPPPSSCSIGNSRRRWSYAASSASSKVYDVVGKCGPGNLLFPTNFTRLTLGPTLTANNPALRSRNFPPAPAFSDSHAIRAGVLRGPRGKLS